MTFSQWCKRIKEKCETNCPECPLNKGGGNGRSCCDLIDDEAYEMTACEVISLMGALKDRHHVWLREQKAKEVAMTDEQLGMAEIRVRVIVGDGPAGPDLDAVLAEVRRLRDLERLLRPFVKLDPDSEEPIYLLDGANAWTSEDAEKVQAIGRLLYGQND